MFGSSPRQQRLLKQLFVGGAALLALGGCAATRDPSPQQQERTARELAKALDGRVAGETSDCVSNLGLSGPQAIGDRTLIYQSGNTLWRNDLPFACPGLRGDPLLVVRIFGSKLCERDIINVQQRTAPSLGSTCLLGKFTEYRKPKAR